MNTYMAKGETVERKWYVVDAEGMVLGRLASQVAAILRGKNKPIYTPHVDYRRSRDHRQRGQGHSYRQTSWIRKSYYHHTGYPGGLKELTYRQLMAKKPEFAVYEAIRLMMPKGPLGRQMLKKVRIYAGSEHKNAAQKPETLVLK